MKFTCTCLLLFLISLGAFAQVTISGKITDEQHQPIPFASVYIKNTTKGTSANSEGGYVLQLSPGSYEVQYKAVGYKQETRKFDITKSQSLDVILKTETY